MRGSTIASYMLAVHPTRKPNELLQLAEFRPKSDLKDDKDPEMVSLVSLRA